jgi:hypothetical protein
MLPGHAPGQPIRTCKRKVTAAAHALSNPPGLAEGIYNTIPNSGRVYTIERHWPVAADARICLQARDVQRREEQARSAAILQEQLAERQRQRLREEEMRDQVGACGAGLKAVGCVGAQTALCQQQLQFYNRVLVLPACVATAALWSKCSCVEPHGSWRMCFELTAAAAFYFLEPMPPHITTGIS